MFAAGQILAGRYRLLRLLGGGGMGAVWAARNEAIDREVAIKVMLPQIASDPVALQRFFNEAKICGSIRHPGIVDVLDLGTAEDGSPFLVMEVLHGESLETLLFRKRRLLPSQILEIVRDVARTIALAHQKDVVHRDLKPANLFLHRLATGQEVVKVLDFGISKVLTPGGNVKTTQTGAVVGSPAYMSPEQALGKVAIDHRTDIYALGVILYEAMSGRLPFEGENYNALIVDIATSDPPDLAALVPGLPGPVISLVRDAMAKDRNKRIQTMNELAERIEALLPGAAGADQAVAARSGEVVITGEQVVIGEAVTQAMALQKTASSLTTSVTLPKSPRRFLPLGVAGVIVAGIGVAALVRKPSTSSPVVAHVPSTAVVVSSIPPSSAAPQAASPASAASPPGGEASGPLVSPGPPVSATAPPPPASASAPPARSAKVPPPTKPPVKGGGVWGYD
ncbi:MAG: serine/threonine-protein kinase [Byssovorax sp.]